MIPTISWRSLLRRAGRKGFDPALPRSSAEQPAWSRGCAPVQNQSVFLGEPCMQQDIFTKYQMKGQMLPGEATIILITPAEARSCAGQRNALSVQATAIALDEVCGCCWSLSEAAAGHGDL